MDGDERKIGLLIAAFDQERERTAEATAALRQAIDGLGPKVDAATGTAIGNALATLRSEADQVAQAMRQLRRFTLWQSAWRHLTTALCAIVITVLVVRWYVPSVPQMNALRAERSQLQALIEELNNQGARMQHAMCGAAGQKKRFCVLVPKKYSFWDSSQNPDEAYVVPVGY
jgi:uncharacterized protein YukE